MPSGGPAIGNPPAESNDAIEAAIIVSVHRTSAPAAPPAATAMTSAATEPEWPANPPPNEAIELNGPIMAFAAQMDDARATTDPSI